MKTMWKFHQCDRGMNFHAFSMIFIFAVICFLPQFSEAQEFMPAREMPLKYVPDTRIDNMGYWRRLAELGLVTVQPARPMPDMISRTSKLSAPGIATYDSPDIPVTETHSLQSENSIFVDPLNGSKLFNSNNSHPAPYTGTLYGADALQSENGGLNWDGTIQGAGGYNFGDPAVAISRNGRMYVGYIYSGGGQGISYSDNNGQTWSKRGVASAPSGFGNILDKNHLWIDNSLSSPYLGYLYDGWTEISGGSSGSGQLQVSRSMDGGLAWQMPVYISTAVLAGSHNQGINLQTGPLGEVYAVWAIYDSWPADEKALGFARSLNGGQNWQPAKRIFNNIKGIRNEGVYKSMRVNSFPSMTVDNSNGPDRGSIYVVWANNGEPGINEGSGVDIYMIKSIDNGATWSAPSRINQDVAGTGKKHYFPWITCDPDNGNLAVVFYDDRNVPDNMCETWVAVSKNGGLSWQDFRVSDVAFSPEPLTGASDNYFGDYLGITSKGGMVYPCWTDNRTGEAMGYVSPFRIGPPPGQAFIDFYTQLVNDSLSGNGNGKAEFGETFALSLSMRNIGDQPDSAVNVTISCESPYVQIINSSQYFGDFESGQIKNMAQSFLIRLSDSVPDDSELLFTLSATDIHDSIFLSSMIIRSHAPHLTIGPLIIIDTAGNGNSHLDPGESVILASVLTNTGDYLVPSAVSSLSTQQQFCLIYDPVVVTGALAPGQSDTVFWKMDIGAGISAGSAAGFIDSVSYLDQKTDRLFLKKIGVLTEDWESGDLSKMAWKTGGDKRWSINNFMVYEGENSLRSGYIKSLDTSYLSIVLNLSADDSISFYRKVSSELNYDFLNFYIDNLKVGQWSGDKQWARVSFPVPVGMHTLKWEYTKDNGTNAGYDAAWIDFIEFPIQQHTTVNAGPDARVCEGIPYQAESVATNYQSLNWNSSGTGIFNDATIFNTVYYPSPADYAAGSVQLIITLKGFSYGETIKDTVILTFAPKPTINAGSDTFTCTGNIFKPKASASNYLSVRWTTAGDGSFNSPDILLPEYTIGINEIRAGKAMLVLTVIPETVCPILIDTLNIDILQGFSATLSSDTTICKGDSAVLKLSLTGPGPWQAYLADGVKLNFQKSEVLIPVSPLNTTTYRIDSIANHSGCFFRSVLTTTVHVLQSPSVEITAPFESCAGRQIILQAVADDVAGYRWTPGEATTSFISSTLSGNVGEVKKFKVQVTGKSGCKSSDSLSINLVAECIDRKAGEMDVRYYPNPTNGDFTIVLSSVISETADISISTIDNKQVYNLEKIPVFGVKTLNLQLKSLAQGTYILYIRCGTGELKDKLVVKK